MDIYQCVTLQPKDIGVAVIKALTQPKLENNKENK